MSEQVFVYPTGDQRDRWEDRADDMDMKLSEYVAAMAEAGAKKFDRSFKPDETNDELRAQRADLRDELQDARDRIERLEDQLYRSERGAITEFVEDNPGTTYDEIIRHVLDTAPSRVVDKLDTLEGDELRVDPDDDGNDRYYPVDGGAE